MATQKDVWISGRMGNVIFYKRGDKHVARLAPSKVKRSRNMKSRNQNFGLASSMSAFFRRVFSTVIPGYQEKSMHSAFSGAISKWLNTADIKTLPSTDTIPYVSGFHFKEGSTDAEHWLNGIESAYREEKIVINIPVLRSSIADLMADPKSSVILKIAAAHAGFKYKDYNNQVQEEIKYTLNSDHAGRQLIMPMSVKTGEVCMIAASVEFINPPGTRKSKRTECLCKIVGAFYKKQ